MVGTPTCRPSPSRAFRVSSAAPWWYVAAPAGTPADIVKKLSDEITKGIRSEAVIKKIREAGAAELPGDFRGAGQADGDRERQVEEGDRGRQAGAAMMPSELKGKIQTVLGPIAPEALGRR